MAMEHSFKESTIANVAVEQVSIQLLASVSGRKFATISNSGNEDVWLGLGVTAELNKGMLLPPGFTLTIDGDRPFTGIVYGISASGSNNCGTSEAI